MLTLESRSQTPVSRGLPGARLSSDTILSLYRGEAVAQSRGLPHGKEGGTRVKNSGRDVTEGCFFGCCDHIGLLIPHPYECKTQLCSTMPAWGGAYFQWSSATLLTVHGTDFTRVVFFFLILLALWWGHPAPK